jgi:hypothetical protein
MNHTDRDATHPTWNTDPLDVIAYPPCGETEKPFDYAFNLGPIAIWVVPLNIRLRRLHCPVCKKDESVLL